MNVKKLSLVTPLSIYDYLKGIDTMADNPFEVEAVNEPFDQFCTNYLSKDIKEHNEAWMALVELIRSAEENAFLVGFSVAKELLR